ncbi:MAG: hypothetical protein M1828_006271 [Chrysothrix sp. TS-e1954]|nr:MAG: hypothetical protein M1828_006271 [Chrysothrix sp. TS-e1954]
MSVAAEAPIAKDVLEASQYPLPKPTKDAKAEIMRLDGQHDMFEVATGAMSHVPTNENIERVLDVGCGTGIWCEAYAEAHPTAQILGVDIAPPLLDMTNHKFPPNCAFQKFNIEDDWDHLVDEGPFDYIHARMLILAVRDWPRLFRQIHRCLKPGGFVETFEGNVQLEAAGDLDPRDSSAIRWYNSLREHMASVDINPSAALDFGIELKTAGFTMLIERQFQTHLDPSRSSLDDEEQRQYVANFQQHNWTNLIDRMTPKIFETSKHVSVDQGIQLAAEARQDILHNGALHGYFITLGQKPQKNHARLGLGASVAKMTLRIALHASKDSFLAKTESGAIGEPKSATGTCFNILVLLTAHKTIVITYDSQKFVPYKFAIERLTVGSGRGRDRTGPHAPPKAADFKAQMLDRSVD